MPLIGWRACRGLNVSDDALMTRVFASPWSNMPPAPKGWMVLIPWYRRCMPSWHCIWLRACEKPWQKEKVARCKRRSNLPDLTLIHGRGMEWHNHAEIEANYRPGIWRCFGFSWDGHCVVVQCCTASRSARSRRSWAWSGRHLGNRLLQ